MLHFPYFFQSNILLLSWSCCGWWKFWLTPAAVFRKRGKCRRLRMIFRWHQMTFELSRSYPSPRGGATSLLPLSCLDTPLPPLRPPLSPPPRLAPPSVEWSFCELAACIWSPSNLLLEIRKWCAQSFRKTPFWQCNLWAPWRPNWWSVFEFRYKRKQNRLFFFCFFLNQSSALSSEIERGGCFFFP